MWTELTDAEARFEEHLRAWRAVAPKHGFLDLYTVAMVRRDGRAPAAALADPPAAADALMAPVAATGWTAGGAGRLM